MDAARSLKLDPAGAEQSIAKATDDFSGAAGTASVAGAAAAGKAVVAARVSPVDAGFRSAAADIAGVDGRWSGSYATKGAQAAGGASRGVAKMSDTETENAVRLRNVTAEPVIEI